MIQVIRLLGGRIERLLEAGQLVVEIVLGRYWHLGTIFDKLFSCSQGCSKT